ncbi:hypothetical protein KY285_019282 [Solanum tuberosum]|nr:hypothetical protein KY285_019282 [Solanum tuberosum]
MEMDPMKDNGAQDRVQPAKQKEAWQIVTFRKKSNPNKRKELAGATVETNTEKGIHVNLFHAESGKYLESKVFKYKKASKSSRESSQGKHILKILIKTNSKRLIKRRKKFMLYLLHCSKGRKKLMATSQQVTSGPSTNSAEKKNLNNSKSAEEAESATVSSTPTQNPMLPPKKDTTNLLPHLLELKNRLNNPQITPINTTLITIDHLNTQSALMALSTTSHSKLLVEDITQQHTIPTSSSLTYAKNGNKESTPLKTNTPFTPSSKLTQNIPSTNSNKSISIPIHSIYIDLPILSKNAKKSSLIPEEKSKPKTLISKSQEQSHSKPNDHEPTPSCHSISNLPSELGEHTFYATHAPEPNQSPHSWLKISLQGQALCFSAIVEERLVAILVQNPTFLVQIVSEGMRRVMKTYNNHLWLSTVLQPPLSFPFP